MYKLQKDSWGIPKKQVLRVTDNAAIPFDPANTDYQKFKADVTGGKELQNADGNLMSSEDAIAYVKTLP